MDTRELEALNRKIAERKDERARTLGALEQTKERAATEFGVTIVVEEKPDPSRPGATILSVDTSAADEMLQALETKLSDLDNKIEQESISLRADLTEAGF